jgi:hypothetical protein
MDGLPSLVRHGRPYNTTTAISVEKERQRSCALSVGHLRKPEVRGLAKRHGLPTAETPEGQDACLVALGESFVAGGTADNTASVLESAEVHDPNNGTFLPAGSMTEARVLATATLLPSGQILVAGGSGRVDQPQALSSADLYDPASGAFTATGAMTAPRENHTATLLSNGKGLIAGGLDQGYLSSAELYDATGGTFTSTIGTMTMARGLHTATLLANSRAFITGGIQNGPNPGEFTILDSAELYH